MENVKKSCASKVRVGSLPLSECQKLLESYEIEIEKTKQSLVILELISDLLRKSISKHLKAKKNDEVSI